MGVSCVGACVMRGCVCHAWVRVSCVGACGWCVYGRGWMCGEYMWSDKWVDAWMGGWMAVFAGEWCKCERYKFAFMCQFYPNKKLQMRPLRFHILT